MVRPFCGRSFSRNELVFDCRLPCGNTHCKCQFRIPTLRLTSFTDYGLRVLMRIAGDPARAFTAADLAAEFQVSRNHLAKVISALAAAGLLETRRGGGGGAMLARPAEAIPLGDVVAMLEADQALVECFATSGSACTLSPQCRLKARLTHAETAFVADLNRSTLADCVYRPESI
jgi:Rrf2 family nitric oxide-sensitive transcriptional repressor